MISQLRNMLELLSEYKHDKATLMQTYVAQRLDKSFAQYDQELQQSILMLSRKHEKSILKRIQKLDDKPDR